MATLSPQCRPALVSFYGRVHGRRPAAPRGAGSLRLLLCLVLLAATLAAEEVPLIRRATQLYANDGRQVCVQAKYEVFSIAPYPDRSPSGSSEPLPDGQVVMSKRAARLRLEDGTVLLLGIRPKDEVDRFDGRGVRATGKLVLRPAKPAPEVSSPLPQPMLEEVSEVRGYP